MLRVQGVGSNAGGSGMQRGGGALAQQPVAFGQLTLVAYNLQQGLGVPAQVVVHGLRQSQAAAHLYWWRWRLVIAMNSSRIRLLSFRDDA